MKLLNHIGLLGLILCCWTPLIATQTALAQSSDYLPGDTPPPSDRPIADASIETFYRELTPYGRWVDTPEYGRVWIPNVETGFVPYASRGHWIVTSYGNTWVSDYPWGWAAFHYGRWYWNDRWGWTWVPGKIWGPSWVVWRSGGGYYGWAPLTPSVTININIPIAWWTYAPQTYITSPQIYNYYLPAQRIVEIHKNTAVIVNNYRVNNRTYVYGPKRQEIEKVTNSNVSIYRVDRSNKPGATTIEGRSVRIYQPTITNSQSQDRSTSATNNNSERRATVRQRTYYRDGNATSGSSPTIDTDDRRYRQNSTSTSIPDLGAQRDRQWHRDSSAPSNDAIERARRSRQESTIITAPNSVIEHRQYARPDSTDAVTTDRHRERREHNDFGERGGGRFHREGR